MPTANMGLTQPTVGGSTDTWGATLNTDLDIVDAHDHTTGKGVKVPTGGLNINADLPFGGFACTGLKLLDLDPITAPASGYLTSIFVNVADNELYWRTSGGSNVKLTSGTSLNAALLGGFTGDYGVGGSTAAYSDASKIFNFLQAANHRAKIDAADIRLFEPTAGITNAVKIKSPSGLAASYDWVFPTALPGSTSLLQITTAGQVQTTRTPSIDTLTTSGVVTAGGLITASGGVTAAVDQHVTVSGTGHFKHGARTKNIPLTPMALIGGVTAFDNEPVLEFGTTADGGGFITIPFEMETGQRILAVDFYWDFTTAGSAGDIDCDLHRFSSAGADTLIATQVTVGGGDQTVTLSAVNHVVLDATSYFVRFSPGGGWDRVAQLVGIRITYDRP